MRFRSAAPAVLSIVLMLLPSCRKPQLSDRIKGSLEELDGYVASRPVYETRKKGQLDALRRLLQASNDPFRSYDLCESLANEFFAYSFDSTQYGRYGKGVTLWNLMLDDKGRPNRPGGCTTCFGAVAVSSSDYSLKGITRNSHYYNVAHCSKVLRPGAVRLGTEGFTAAGLTYQWYRNPDGSYALLLLNESGSDVQVNFVTGKYSVACRVPSRAIQSVLWSE